MFYERNDGVSTLSDIDTYILSISYTLTMTYTLIMVYTSTIFYFLIIISTLTMV